MHARLVAFAVITAALFASVSSRADAAMYTYTATGNVWDAFGSWDSTVQAGTAVTLSLILESTSSPASTTSSDTIYNALSGSFSVGDYAYTGAGVGSAPTFDVVNGTQDGYIWQLKAGSVNELTGVTVGLTAVANSNTAINSSALSTVALSMSTFSGSSYINMSTSNGRGFIASFDSYTVTPLSAVPEPTTAGLLGLCSIALLLRRHHR